MSVKIPEDIMEQRSALNALIQSVGFAMLCAEYDGRRDQLRDAAMMMNTKPKETQQIKRAVQELNNHHPRDLVRSLINTLAHRTTK